MVDLGRGAWYRYQPGWLDPADADGLLAALTAEVTWEQRPIVVAGREILQPRLIGWAGELPYRYSGQTLPPRAPTPGIGELVVRVSAACDASFNHVLLNRYRDGRDNIGLHADSERELGRSPLIAALSLGAERKFVLARKGKRRSRKTLRLGHGSLLVMGGEMQRDWYHALPKDRWCAAERVNVTFRWLKGPPGWREPHA